MWLRYILVLVALIVLFLPVNAVPTDYQDEIFNLLKLGLDSNNKSNCLGGNDYKALQNYLRPHQGSLAFKAYAEKHRWNLKTETKDDWFLATINDRGFTAEMLRLYPLNDNGRFTLASFEDQNNESFLKLPIYLRKFYQKRFLKTQRLLKTNPEAECNFNQPTPANQLHKELPQLFQDDYWLVSPVTCQKAQIDSLFCTTYIMYGQYQIELKTKNNLPQVLFMFKPEGGQALPKIIQPQVAWVKIPKQFRNNRKLYIAPISRDNNLFYIASKENSTARFEMLWNAPQKRMVYLQVRSGLCYGNERMDFTKNTLLQYQGNHYLLRSINDLSYTEVVYFRGNNLQEICHADHTAPEI